MEGSSYRESTVHEKKKNVGSAWKLTRLPYWHIISRFW